ncbi:MAG: endonuclease/exonuclease/phosphatase family protein [Flavobacteriales bacterium]
MNHSLREWTMMSVLLGLCVCIAFAPDAYLPMLLRAFILPAIWIAAAAMLWGAWRRCWSIAGGAAIGALLMLSQFDRPGSNAAVHADVVHQGAPLRVFHMNVLQPNTAYAAAIAEAAASQADIVSVQEVDQAWAGALQAGLCARYPYSHLVPRGNCYGLALFSKLPFAGVRTVEIAGAPHIEACFEVDRAPLRLLAVHATSPISYAHFQRRNEQLRELADRIAGSDTATIVLGDLNTVPWDQAFRRFCANAGLRSVAPSEYRTWPSIGPFAAIPLDHILVSKELYGAGFKTVAIPGSDHRGLYAELHRP